MRYFAVAICSVSLSGLCAPPFAAETKGQPLPEYGEGAMSAGGYGIIGLADRHARGSVRRTRSHRPYLVFISHSSKDQWIARQMSNLIEQRGKANHIVTFLDEKDIHSGESIPESIRAKIRECDEFVVLLSRYSIDRQWVLVEVGAAWGLDKHIVAITDKITPEEMPEITRSHKALDLNEFDRYVEEVVARGRKGS